MEERGYGGWDYHMQLTLFLFSDVFGWFLAQWKRTMREQSVIEKNAHSDTMELKKGLNIEWVACDSLVCESLVGQCAGRILVCHAELEKT